MSCTDKAAVLEDKDASLVSLPKKDSGSAVDGASDAASDAADAAADADAGPNGCNTPAITGTDSNWRGVYWGTLHDHTSWSLDAYYKGTSTGAGPDEAFKFAKGGYKATNGATLTRGLDWAAITDHSEFFDQMYGCHFTADKDAGPYNTSFCQNCRSTTNFGYKRQSELVDNPPKFVCQQSNYQYGCPKKATLKSSGGALISECEGSDYGTTDCDGLSRSMWDKSQEIADSHNEAGRKDGCKFATLNAFEYSSNMRTGDGKTMNLHRNIVFRGSNSTKYYTAADKVTKNTLDFIAYPTTTKLWSQLNEECTVDSTDTSKTCKAIAIPHNPNDSGGSKWDVSGASKDGENDKGALRSKFERLVEIFQHKGSSECLNSTQTGTDGKDGYDALCEFELGTTTTGATNAQGVTGVPDRNTDIPGYVRSGLSQGILAYHTSNNTLNPLQLGISASLDSHNATPGYTPENGFLGNTATDDDTNVKRTQLTTGKGATLANNTQRYWNSGGLTAVWAKNNSREGVYDGLASREAYGTSGTRPLVWFFMLGANDNTDYCTQYQGGSSFTPDVASIVRKNGGIPMGSSFAKGQASYNRFLVVAQKDTSFTTTSGMDAHNIYEIDLVQSYVSAPDGGTPTTKEAVFRHRALIGSDAGNVDNPDGYSSMCNIFADSDPSSARLATDGVTTLKDAFAAPGAYWYARVVESKTYSWRYYDCEALKTASDKCASDFTGEGPDAQGKYIDNGSYKNPFAMISERAWTSPIWLAPAPK